MLKTILFVTMTSFLLTACWDDRAPAQTQAESRFLQKDHQLHKRQGKARSLYNMQVSAQDLGSQWRLEIRVVNHSSQSQHSFEWVRKNAQGEEVGSQQQSVTVAPGESWQIELLLNAEDLTEGDTFFFIFSHLEGKERYGATQSWQYRPSQDTLESLSIEKSNTGPPRIRE